jgi:hypothetical protein
MKAGVQPPRRVAAHLIAVALLAGPAANGSAQGMHVVKVTAPATVAIAAGGSGTVRVQVSVKPGYHVQANPVRNPSLIPITLELERAGDVLTGRPVYPPSKLFRIAGSAEDLVVYDGAFVIESPVRVGPAQLPAQVVLSGTLRYQACTDRLCLAPRSIPVRVPIRVVSQR